jgi:hypothetical protein
LETNAAREADGPSIGDSVSTLGRQDAQADFRSQPLDQSLAHPLDSAATPEIRQAIEIASRNLDAPIRLEDGTDTTMAELLRHVDEVEATAKTEASAFRAAVECALRFPQ